MVQTKVSCLYYVLAFMPFLHFLIVPKDSLKYGVCKFIVSCALDSVLDIFYDKMPTVALR